MAVARGVASPSGGIPRNFLAPPSYGFIVRLMRYKLLFALPSTLFLAFSCTSFAQDVEPGFTALCDGKTFTNKNIRVKKLD